MARQDSLRLLITTNMLLWLGLMFAPALLADEAWQPIEHQDFDLMFVATDTPAGIYQNVYLEPVSVWYPGGSGEASAQLLRQRADERFRGAIRDFGMRLAAEPDDASMILRIQLIDLKSGAVSDADIEWARTFRFRVQPGRVTLVAEFLDAASGRVVARIADLEDSPAGAPGVAFELDRALAVWGEALASGAAATAGASLLADAHRGDDKPL